MAEAPAAGRVLRGLVPGRTVRPAASGGLFLLAGGAATSVVILIATAALGTSAWSLLGAGAGYPSAGLAELIVDFRGRDFVLDHRERVRLLERLARRIEALPGVEGAAWADQMPDSMSGRNVSVSLGQPGPPSGREARPSLQFRARSVSPHFLGLLRVPILSGRGFLDTDAPPAPPVIPVDPGAARVTLSESELGELVNLGYREPRVVGMVPSIPMFPGGRVAATIYEPFAAPLPLGGELASVVVAVRFREPPDTDDLASLAALPPRVDSSLRVLRVESVRDRRRRGLGAPAAAVSVLGVFAVCGILMAVAGAVGQVADRAARAAQPLAIRAALGAPPDAIVWETVRGALTAAGLAVLVGCGAGWLLVRFIASRVLWVQADSLFLYVGPAALLSLLILVAGLVTGIRASRAAPWGRLRCD